MSLNFRLLFFTASVFFISLSYTCEKKVLLVSPYQSYDQLKEMCHNPENRLPIYSKSWLKIIDDLSKENIAFDLTYHNSFKETYSRFHDKYDLYIFHDFRADFNKIDFSSFYPKSILILFESFATLSHEFDMNFINKFPLVFTWKDPIVNDKEIVKFFYPVLKPMEYERESFSSRKFACLLATNKFHNEEGELFSERLKIIEYFNSRIKDFHLYGRFWDEGQGLAKAKKKYKEYKGICWVKEVYKAYRGVSLNKHETLKNYKFNFCLENCVSKGYITEKLFDAFASGTVPIYKGPPDITSSIPKECFISYDDFATLNELEYFLLNFNERQYEEYLENVRKFLTSQQAYKFSSENFVNTVKPRIIKFLSEKP